MLESVRLDPLGSLSTFQPGTVDGAEAPGQNRPVTQGWVRVPVKRRKTMVREEPLGSRHVANEEVPQAI